MIKFIPKHLDNYPRSFAVMLTFTTDFGDMYLKLVQRLGLVREQLEHLDNHLCFFVMLDFPTDLLRDVDLMLAQRLGLVRNLLLEHLDGREARACKFLVLL